MEPKTYVFDGAGGTSTVDPNLLLAMNGGCGFGGGMNSPIWALIILGLLRQWGYDGNGCNGHNAQLSQIQETLNTNQGNTLLMNAITTQGSANVTATKELASAVNCNYNAMQAAISAIQQQIANKASQDGMSFMQVVNAINNGDSMLANTLQSCCCDIKNLVNTQGYENRLNNERQSQLIQNGFSQVGYASAEQTCSIKQAIADQTIALSGKLDAMESARKDREIASLTAQLATVNARAERAAELAPITQKLNDIMCKQPNTVTVPYQPFVTVPSCVAWNAGLNALSGYGLYGANGGVFG